MKVCSYFQVPCSISGDAQEIIISGRRFEIGFFLLPAFQEYYYG